ncbi:unnamed protein product [Discosporangium mesarthrocarpum]
MEDKTCIALFDFTAQGPRSGEQLSFRKGDYINLKRLPSGPGGDGWGLGEINGKSGWFPVNHVAVSGAARAALSLPAPAPAPAPRSVSIIPPVQTLTPTTTAATSGGSRPGSLRLGDGVGGLGLTGGTGLASTVSPVVGGLSAGTSLNPSGGQGGQGQGKDIVRALFNYVAQDMDEVGFWRGDLIEVLERNGGWWRGTVGGSTGL